MSTDSSAVYSETLSYVGKVMAKKAWMSDEIKYT